MKYVLDQLSGLGKVSARRMFGGAGIYCAGKMFGVIADDVAYLKVDDSNRKEFEKAGSGPFRPYPEKGGSAVMSYYEIPPEILENPEKLVQWARRSLKIQQSKSARKVSRRRL